VRSQSWPRVLSPSPSPCASSLTSTRLSPTMRASTALVLFTTKLGCFTAIHEEAGCCPDFVYPGSQMPVWIGSPTLWHHWSGGTIILERVDGHIAELAAVSPDGTAPDYGPIALTFIGNKEDGSAVTAMFSAGQWPAITRLEFPRTFKNLLTVSWRQGGGSAPEKQLTNSITW
jgi:hypothetical protein